MGLRRPLGKDLQEDAAARPWKCPVISTSCPWGWWCYQDELQHCLQGLSDDFCFLPLHKPFWLAPVAVPDSGTHPDFGRPVRLKALCRGKASVVRPHSYILVAVLVPAGRG